MIFTNSSFLMCLLFSNILSILLCILFRNTRFMIDIGYRLLALFLIITLLRFLLPFEIACSTNILLPETLSRIIIFLKTPNIVLGKCTLSVWHLFLIVWLVGSGIAFLRLLLSYHRFYQIVRRLGTDISREEPYRSLLQQICQERHKRCRFHIVQLPGISSPMVTGISKPHILFPDNLNADRQDLYYIISHEVSHIFHHDMVVKLMAQFLCVIYWWNPFTGLLKKQISTMLELRIDLQLTASPDPQIRVNYLDCLLRAAKSEQQAAEPAISFCNASESLLKQRFSMIISHRKKKSRWKQISFSLLFVGLYAFSTFFIFEPHYMSPEEAEGTFVPTPENAYLVEKKDGTYDLYYKDSYMSNLHTIDEGFVELPVYQNPKEDSK